MMRKCVVAISVACLLWGCKVKNNQYCDEVTSCGDPERPFCDLAGAYPASAGVANNCIACEPNAFLGCLGETASSCNADGSERLSEACEYGCDAAAGRCNECEPGASVCVDDQTTVCGVDGRVISSEACWMGCHLDGTRCYDVEPSNDLALYLDQTAEAEDLVLSDGATIDTDTGEVIDGDGAVIEVESVVRPSPEDGVPVRAFLVGGFTAGDVTVTGEPAIAVLSDGEIVLTGEFSVSATQFRDGPGAIAPALFGPLPPCSGTISGGFNDGYIGYSGGGNATAGGDGGAVGGHTVRSPGRQRGR